MGIELEEDVVYTVWLKGPGFPVRLLKKIFKNENGSTGLLYLVSNNMTSSAERIYEVCQKRWRIEGAPQAHKVVMKGFIMKCCKAIGKMVVGPPIKNQ